MRATLCGCLTLLLCCLVVAGCRPRTNTVKVGISKPDPNKQPTEVADKGMVAADKKGTDKKGGDKNGATKQDKKDKTPAPQPAVNTKPTFVIKAFGVWELSATGDDKDAERQSLAASEARAKENGRAVVIDYLRRQGPPLLWEPDSEYVFKSFMRGKGEPTRCPDEDNIVDGKKMLCWSWPVVITPQQLEEMRREDAHFRLVTAVKERTAVAETRMLELSRFVGWAVLALLGVCGFIRLEEWSRGTKQRRCLRVALAMLLCIGGVGWWLLS
jgi:hypothetical protein